MAEGLFRKKSMDRVASPEQLNDYIRVANPGVWMFLGGIVLLLAGVCIWGFFGHLDTKYTTGAICNDGILTCSVEETQLEQVNVGMPVIVEDREYKIERISGSTVSFTCDLPDGEYTAQIILESTTPMSFVTN